MQMSKATAEDLYSVANILQYIKQLNTDWFRLSNVLKDKLLLQLKNYFDRKYK